MTVRRRTSIGPYAANRKTTKMQIINGGMAMKTLTINSRTLKQKITFSRPGGGYIYADLNGLSGVLGKQICDGGEVAGNTIYCAGDDATLARICRKWFRAYMRETAWMRE